MRKDIKEPLDIPTRSAHPYIIYIEKREKYVGGQTKPSIESENYGNKKLGNPDWSLQKSPRTNSGIMSHHIV